MIYRKIHTEMLTAVGLINIDSVDYYGIDLRGGALVKHNSNGVQIKRGLACAFVHVS